MYMTNVWYLEPKDFDNEDIRTLKQSVCQGKPCIVMVQSMGCGHCSNNKPLFDELSKNNNNIVCLTAPSDDKEYGMMMFLKQSVQKGQISFPGVPVFLFYDKNGKMQPNRTKVGFTKPEELLEMIN